MDDSFLKLPEELSGSVLMEWLPVRALMAVDSAYCNTLKRPILLNSVFSSSVCLYHMAPPKCITTDFMNWVCLRGIRRKELSLSDGMNIERFEEYVSKVGEHVRRLKLVEVGDFTVNAAEVIPVTSLYCRSLVSLTISQCVVSETIIDLLYYCCDLQELRILNCDEGLQSILDMSNMKGLTYSHISSAVLHCVESTWLVEAVLLLNDPASLVQLSVRCDDIPVIHALQQQLLHAVHLCSLGLPRSRLLSDGLLIEIVAACPSVKNFDISGCMELTDASGIALTQHLVHLTTLNISYCLFTNAVLVALTERCAATLAGLYAHSCGKLMGEGLNQFLRNCLQLRTFAFGCCDMYAPALEFELMGALTTLEVDDILPEDEEEIFEFVAAHCTQLQHLRLCFEEGYEHFDFSLFGAEHLPNLQSLVVYYPVNRYQHVHATPHTHLVDDVLAWFDNQAALLIGTNLPAAADTGNGNGNDIGNPGTVTTPVPNVDTHDPNIIDTGATPGTNTNPGADPGIDPIATANTTNGHPISTNKKTAIMLDVPDVTTHSLRALQIARPSLVVKHGREAFEYNLLDLKA